MRVLKFKFSDVCGLGVQAGIVAQARIGKCELGEGRSPNRAYWISSPKASTAVETMPEMA